MKRLSWTCVAIAIFALAFGDGIDQDSSVITDSHDDDATAPARRQGLGWLSATASSRRRGGGRPSPRPSPRPTPRPTPSPTPTPRFGGGFRPASSTGASARPSPRPSPTSSLPRPSPPSATPPSPTPGGGSRRRGTPHVNTPIANVNSRRRGAISPAIPSSNLGNPSQRRRLGNSDRINPTPDARRRSSNGWETDYNRRRGYSGTTVAAAGLVGFGGGIVLGSMINSNNGQYYHHAQGWTDSNGGYHQQGYYSESGYHYSSPQEFGYCPGFGDPGYVEGCDTEPAGGGGGGGIVPTLISLLICCCCCCLCAWAMSKMVGGGGGGGGDGEGKYQQQSDDGNVTTVEGTVVVTTIEGKTIPRGDAIAFLQAVEAEYVDGSEGAVGNLFAERSFLPQVVSRLDCEEGKIRDSGDSQGAVFQLANRWDMRDMLQHGDQDDDHDDDDWLE